MALLEVADLHAGYGRIEVLHGVSLALEGHTLCAIVGANGAGKSTLLLTISRLLTARRGRIDFDGRDITRAASHDVVRAGLVQVPEGRRMLAHLSVAENLLVASVARRTAGARADIAALYERFPVLGARRNVPAGSLSGGEQQMLALARAL
ncbi:MAG TPA: ATP-binding cassette domain-containing protein, partial [Candidatus Baltobacteraceae bacterium]|nr:ATP-binding cassette domain-containing protein [Candidatus Baltobacteraceae bacterium]